jgi:hypothetical protein
MGNAQTRQDIKQIEEDLRMLRTISPEVHRPIDWNEEISVTSYIACNTMENIVNIERQKLKRAGTMSELSRLIRSRSRSPNAPARGKQKLPRSVSFCTDIESMVGEAAGSYDIDSGACQSGGNFEDSPAEQAGFHELGVRRPEDETLWGRTRFAAVDGSSGSPGGVKPVLQQCS